MGCFLALLCHPNCDKAFIFQLYLFVSHPCSYKGATVFMQHASSY